MPHAAPVHRGHRAKAARVLPERPSSAARGYGGKRWAFLRAQVFLRDLYICQAAGCGVLCRPKAADPSLRPHCDHIVPRSAGGADKMDNLQTLCGACHSAKTMRETRGGGAK